MRSLRWTSPLEYFRRTVTADTKVQGVEIKAATRWRCTTCRPTATRMSATTPNGSTSTAATSTGRSGSPSYRLGVRLARLEGRVFAELLATCPTIELFGKPLAETIIDR